MKHIHFNEIDSTNNWAKNHVKHWAQDEMTLVTASFQTAGRGRFKRQWISPPLVNLYASFCFWIDAVRTDFVLIPQILAIAVSQILEEKGFTSLIKWPNDLLIKGKKIAGILCESFLHDDKRGMVCGIGLNINMTQKHLQLVNRPATSLLIESGGQLFDIGNILDDLKKLFYSFLHDFIQDGFASFYPLLLEKSSLKRNENIIFYHNGIEMQGQFLSLQPDGSLEVRMANGISRIFYDVEIF